VDGLDAVSLAQRLEVPAFLMRRIGEIRSNLLCRLWRGLQVDLGR